MRLLGMCSSRQDLTVIHISPCVGSVNESNEASVGVLQSSFTGYTQA